MTQVNTMNEEHNKFATASERSLRELLAWQLRNAADTAIALSTRGGTLSPQKAVLRSLAGDMLEQSREWASGLGHPDTAQTAVIIGLPCSLAELEASVHKYGSTHGFTDTVVTDTPRTISVIRRKEGYIQTELPLN